MGCAGICLRYMGCDLKNGKSNGEMERIIRWKLGWVCMGGLGISNSVMDRTSLNNYGSKYPKLILRTCWYLSRRLQHLRNHRNSNWG